MNNPKLALPRIQRITLNELAYGGLKRALLSGRIEPGSILSLRQLAEQLGTSMMPVREAVSRLCAERALEMLPNRGILVPYLAAEDAADIWDLRIDLEGRACALAAQRASRDNVRRIRRLCAAVENAGRNGDLHELLECNNAFQFAIYQAAANPMLLQLIEMLRMKSVPYCTRAVRTLLRDRPAYFEQCWSNHAALVEAIASGDTQVARRVKQSDLRAFQRFVQSQQGDVT